MRTSTSLRHALVSLALSAAVLGPAGFAHAVTIPLTGAESGSSSTATGVFVFNAQTNTFTFTLTNTSAVTQPGSTSVITSIGFDLPPIGNASASGLNGFAGDQVPSQTSDFAFSDAVLGAVPLFADAVLDFGFLTGGSFGQGNTLLGLQPGESASFTVSGAGFTGFNEGQLANSVFLLFQSVPTGAAAGGVDVAAPGASPTPVPEPATGLLMGLGLAAIAGGAMRRRSTR